MGFLSYLINKSKSFVEFMAERFGISPHDIFWNQNNFSTIINIPLKKIVKEDTITSYNINGKSNDLLIIAVYSKEGDYEPHFHFFNTNGDIDGCIKIYNAEYFPHGHHRSKLTNKQTKILNHILSKKPKRMDYTYWELICESWIKERNKNYKTLITKQPDYSKLNNSAQ